MEPPPQPADTALYWIADSERTPSQQVLCYDHPLAADKLEIADVLAEMINVIIANPQGMVFFGDADLLYQHGDLCVRRRSFKYGSVIESSNSEYIVGACRWVMRNIALAPRMCAIVTTDAGVHDTPIMAAPPPKNPWNVLITIT